MPTIGTCALCKNPASALQGSHIVPEFFYKRVYTKSHKFTAISLNEDERLAIEQKGYREDLLCQDCETKLSKWETVLSQFVTAVVSDNYTNFSTTRDGPVTVVDGVNYSSVKMAVLSIFWRMSISKLTLFSNVHLGPYEETFRRLLDTEQVPSTTEFPLWIAKATLDGKFLPGILFPMSRGKYGLHWSMQSVVLNGILFDCLMTQKPNVPEEFEKRSLQSNGRAFILIQSYENLGLNLGDFSKRMKAKDVKRFYQKY